MFYPLLKTGLHMPLAGNHVSLLLLAEGHPRAAPGIRGPQWLPVWYIQCSRLLVLHDPRAGPWLSGALDEGMWSLSQRGRCYSGVWSRGKPVFLTQTPCSHFRWEEDFKKETADRESKSFCESESVPLKEWPEQLPLERVTSARFGSRYLKGWANEWERERKREKEDEDVVEEERRK